MQCEKRNAGSLINELVAGSDLLKRELETEKSCETIKAEETSFNGNTEHSRNTRVSYTGKTQSVPDCRKDGREVVRFAKVARKRRVAMVVAWLPLPKGR
jgi:hypothetical protein